MIRPSSALARSFLFVALAATLSTLIHGCGGSRGPAPQPLVKTRLTKLLRLYQVYAEKNKKGPPNEAALREFAAKLTSEERDAYLIGDDFETIFISPRDNQKFVIQFQIKPDPGGATRAIAWEATPQNGARFVALNVGQVEEYDDDTLNSYKK